MSKPPMAHKIIIPRPWVPAASTDIRKHSIARELRRLAEAKRVKTELEAEAVRRQQEADAEALAKLRPIRRATK